MNKAEVSELNTVKVMAYRKRKKKFRQNTAFDIGLLDHDNNVVETFLALWLVTFQRNLQIVTEIDVNLSVPTEKKVELFLGQNLP